MTKTMTQIARGIVDLYKPEVLPWGIRFLLGSERHALLIGYAYKNNKYGYKIEWCPNVTQYSVTIWNSKAKGAGCDV